MTAKTARAWTPDSWRACPIRQVPDYPDAEKLAAMEARVGRYPPLVFAGEALVLQGVAGQCPSVGTAGDRRI